MFYFQLGRSNSACSSMRERQRSAKPWSTKLIASTNDLVAFISATSSNFNAIVSSYAFWFLEIQSSILVLSTLCKIDWYFSRAWRSRAYVLRATLYYRAVSCSDRDDSLCMVEKYGPTVRRICLWISSIVFCFLSWMRCSSLNSLIMSWYLVISSASSSLTLWVFFLMTVTDGRSDSVRAGLVEAVGLRYSQTLADMDMILIGASQASQVWIGEGYDWGHCSDLRGKQCGHREYSCLDCRLRNSGFSVNQIVKHKEIRTGLITV